jgi:hypothetical protein
MFVCWELIHHEIYVKIFADIFYQIRILRRCHAEIHVALKYTAHDRTHCWLIVTENKWQMELVTAAHCWQIINKFYAWTKLLAMKKNAVEQSTKLITSLNSECYRPSGILIHQQNLYVPCSKQHICHHEAQSCEPVNKGENLPEDS